MLSVYCDGHYFPHNNFINYGVIVEDDKKNIIKEKRGHLVNCHKKADTSLAELLSILCGLDLIIDEFDFFFEKISNAYNNDLYLDIEPYIIFYNDNEGNLHNLINYNEKFFLKGKYLLIKNEIINKIKKIYQLFKRRQSKVKIYFVLVSGNYNKAHKIANAIEKKQIKQVKKNKSSYVDLVSRYFNVIEVQEFLINYKEDYLTLIGHNIFDPVKLKINQLFIEHEDNIITTFQLLEKILTNCLMTNNSNDYVSDNIIKQLKIKHIECVDESIISMQKAINDLIVQHNQIIYKKFQEQINDLEKTLKKMTFM